MSPFDIINSNEEELICLLQVNFNGLAPLGGAENMALEVAKGFSETHKVIILYGVDNPQEIECFKEHAKNLYSLSSFIYDDEVRYCGEISPNLTNLAKKALEKCTVMFSFERVMKTPVARFNITVLGGTGYPHCEDIASSSKWDMLIVPSNYVYDWCSKFIQPEKKGDVQIVDNGISHLKDSDVFTKSRKNNILIPSRPDIKKGFFETIDFVSMLNLHGNKYIITILKQNSFLENKDFYDQMNLYAQQKNVEIEYEDWVTPDKLGSLYSNALLSTFLGTVPEGFGLSALESISWGTPVLAVRHGALAEILPENHGVLFLDEISVEKFESIIEKARNDYVFRGREYILERYTIIKMISSYRKLLPTAGVE